MQGRPPRFRASEKHKRVASTTLNFGAMAGVYSTAIFLAEQYGQANRTSSVA